MYETRLAKADDMMVAAKVVDDGVQVTFADGCRGVVPWSAMSEVGGAENVVGIELPNPWELRLYGPEGRYPEFGSDYARLYCDESYLERMEVFATEQRRDIGARIRSLRKEAGLTQVSLAKATGIPRVTLVRIEKGDQSAKYETKQAIANALGKSTIDLFLDLLPAQTMNAGFLTDPDLIRLTRLVNGELAAHNSNLQRHENDFVALDLAGDHVLQGLRRVDDGRKALPNTPDNEELMDVMEVWTPLVVRAFKGLRAAKAVCELGYYEQALVLARIAFELLATGFDVPACPETRRKVQMGKDVKLKEVVARVAKDSPQFRLQEMYEQDYNVLSKMAHPSGTGFQLIPFGEEGYMLQLTSSYIEALAQQTLEVIGNLTGMLAYQVRVMSVAVQNDWDAQGAYKLLEFPTGHAQPAPAA